MSAIVKSLENLNTSIGNLEAAIELVEESKSAQQTISNAAVPSGGQQDMFANGTGEAIVKSLDGAIQKVENMLGESS